MKINRLFVMATALVSLLSACPELVRAEGETAPVASTAAAKFGVVDIAKVLDKLPVIKDVQKQIEKMRQDFSKEVSGYEGELRKAEKSLVEAQKKLSEAEFAKKREGFEKRIQEMQQTVEKKKQQLDEVFAAAMEKVNEKVMAAIAEVSKAKGLTIVFFKMGVAYSDDALDISNEITDKVKNTLTELKLDGLTPKKADAPKADAPAKK